MVSPRKRSPVLGRLRSSPKGKSDSPDDWISASSFKFGESPIISRREIKKRRVSNMGPPKKDSQAKNRRQSVLLKRLDLPLSVMATSPVSYVRKTRRQSIAVTTTTHRQSTAHNLVSAKLTTTKLPPSKAAPGKVDSSNATFAERKTSTSLVSEVKISLSPLKFYSSPKKEKSFSQRSSFRIVTEKRKADSSVASNKEGPTQKKIKVDSPEILKSVSTFSTNKRDSSFKKKSVCVESSSKVREKHSASLSHIGEGERSLRSAIPRRATKFNTSVPKKATYSPQKAKKVLSPSPIKMFKTSCPVSPIKDVKSSHPGSPLKKVKTLHSPSPVKKVKTSHSTSPVKKIETSPPASAVKKVRTLRSTSPVKKVKTSHSTSPVKKVKTSHSTSPVKKIETSPPASPVKKGRTLRSTSPVKKVKTSHSTSPVKKVKTSHSTSPVKKVKTSPPASPVKKVKATHPASPVKKIKTLRSTSLVKKVKTSPPALPVKKVETLHSPSPVKNVKTLRSTSPAKKATHPASPVKKVETPSASPVKKVKATHPASPVKKVKTLHSPSPVKKVKTLHSTSLVKKVETSSPASPVKKVRSLRSTSPVQIVKSQNKKKATLTSPSSVKRETILSPMKKLSPCKVERSTSHKQNVTPLKKKTETPSPRSAAQSSKLKLQSVKSSEKKRASPMKVTQDIKTPVTKEKFVPSALKKLDTSSGNKKRVTRSAAKSSRKVTVVGNSPLPLKSSFRKTPASKRTAFKPDVDIGSSPMLSARSQLEMIRCTSPLRGTRKTTKMKAKPYTPKPDSPPNQLLRKTMKRNVAQKMHATTKVEIHQLMNGEISKRVSVSQSRIITQGTSITPRKPIGSKLVDNEIQEISVLPTTPVSTANLPPTPTSSRKLSESLCTTRCVSSRSVSKVSCQRTLPAATPRSSTPIEEDSILKPLSVGSIIRNLNTETNFTDESIDTDQSEVETSVSEVETSVSKVKTSVSKVETSVSKVETSVSKVDGKTCSTPEKPRRSYCVLM